MALNIPDDIIKAAQLSESEFRIEIALYLFQLERLTLGYASQLAKLSNQEFRKLLKERNIPLYNYDVEDFELDLKNLRELGRI